MADSPIECHHCNTSEKGKRRLGESILTSHWQEPHLNFWGLSYEGITHTFHVPLFILFMLDDLGWLTETHLKRERTMTASRTPRPCTLLIQEQHSSWKEGPVIRQQLSSNYSLIWKPAITLQVSNLIPLRIIPESRLLCVGRKSSLARFLH